MKILQVHNFYQQPGGEDQVCAAEYHLLSSAGNSVTQYLVHNDAINNMSKISIGVKTIWNSDTYKRVRAVIRLERPDVIHSHNTFPLISPALYYASSAERVPHRSLRPIPGSRSSRKTPVTAASMPCKKT